jgi:hypothetical protein
LDMDVRKGLESGDKKEKGVSCREQSKVKGTEAPKHGCLALWERGDSHSC